MKTSSTVITAVIVCAAPWLSAQQPPVPDQLPAFRSGVELVTIDVGVVDRQGVPLRGLTPGDFVVTVAGQLRRVVTAEYVDTTPVVKTEAGPPTPALISTNEGGGTGRLFVFIVDQNTLDAGNARYVANAAARFFSRLTFADRSALLLLPVGPNIGFTWAHDRVKEGLRRVTGLGNRMSTWEYGSLTEARDIASRNLIALRSVGDRECRGSILAGGTGGGGGGGGGGGTAGPAPGPAPGGSAPAGGTGAGGTTSGGGSTGVPSGSGTGSRTGGNSALGFGLDACTRDVQMQAEATWREAQTTSLASLAGLRQMLSALGQVHGDKTVILISGGWPLEEREETSTIATVAADAAAARATFFTLFVPHSTFSADRRGLSSTPARDQYLHSGPLETLSAMTGGTSYRTEVNAEGAFDRLARELSGYYRIGVEKDPSDLDGKNRRMKVQVNRGGMTVRARDIFDTRRYEDRDWAARIAGALDSPAPATEVGLRVTSYIAADPDNAANVKLVLTGEASRVEPGEATFQLLVRDETGKKIFLGEQPLGETVKGTVRFSTNVPVSPGTYIVRMAVMDSKGHVGSVDHRVEARLLPLGPLMATAPLLVRVPASTTGEPRLALDGVQQDERLALEVDLEGQEARASGTDVVFEISAADAGAALVHTVANVSAGSRDGSVIAQGVLDLRVLPAGQYIARAKIMSGTTSLGEVSRPFSIAGMPLIAGDPAGVSRSIVGRVAPAALTIRAAGSVPAFALEQVLAPKVLNGYLDRVAARPDASTPAIRELLSRAHAGGIGDLQISDALAEEAPVAAFLRGLSLLSQKRLDDAATSFRAAMRASSDFYPAMVYLGACYAAGGNDKEASGAWRTALIKEGDAVALHMLLTDALLRLGNGDIAFETIDRARRRWPEDEGLKGRFITASLAAGRYADGLRVLDDLVNRRTEDEPQLVLGLLVLYEAFEHDRPIETSELDRARMGRLADAYRARGGSSLALIETWVAAASKKK